MTKYEFKGWTAMWDDDLHGILINHECGYDLYEGDGCTGWGHCPVCKAILTSGTMQHLMNAYQFLRKK